MTQRVSSRRNVASGLACMVMGATALVGGLAGPAGASPQTAAMPSCPAGMVAVDAAGDAAGNTASRATGGQMVLADEQGSDIDAVNMGTDGTGGAGGADLSLTDDRDAAGSASDVVAGIVPRSATQAGGCVPAGWQPGPSPAAAGCCGDMEEPPGNEACCAPTTEPPPAPEQCCTTTTAAPPTPTVAELPRTGSTTGPLVAAGVGLVLIGGTLVVGKRKLSHG